MLTVIMKITLRSTCSDNSYFDNNKMSMCSANSYCENNGEVYM